VRALSTSGSSGGAAAGSAPATPPQGAQRCCHERGLCVSEELVPIAERERFGRESCPDVEQRCVPDAFIDLESLRLQSCRSFAGVEGRCYPECLPEIAALRGELPRGECAAHELCVPCVDPFSGEATSACTLGQDPGPAEAPVVFAACCMAGGEPLGRCLPSGVVPAAAANLPALECEGSGEVCVLDSLRAAPQAGLPECHGRLGGTGACLPECMVDSGLSPLLIRDVCAGGELCVPCAIAGQSTGVCAAR
jgi:hypothetical protein